MTLHNASDAYGEGYVGQECTYCDRVIQGDDGWIVVWRVRAYRRDLALHQRCARSLGLHLVKDSFGEPGTGSYMSP